MFIIWDGQPSCLTCINSKETISCNMRNECLTKLITIDLSLGCTNLEFIYIVMLYKKHM